MFSVNISYTLLNVATLFQLSAITIGFNAIEYANDEDELTLPVTVRKTERLAHPVSLLIEPLTVEDALMRGLNIPLVGDVNITAINPRIPIRARGKLLTK